MTYAVCVHKQVETFVSIWPGDIQSLSQSAWIWLCFSWKLVISDVHGIAISGTIIRAAIEAQSEMWNQFTQWYPHLFGMKLAQWIPGYSWCYEELLITHNCWLVLCHHFFVQVTTRVSWRKGCWQSFGCRKHSWAKRQRKFCYRVETCVSGTRLLIENKSNSAGWQSSSFFLPA